MPPRWLHIVLVGLSLHLLGSGSAAGHAALVATEPADGATVETPPPAVTLRFDEPVEPVTVRVVGPGGAPLAAPAVEAAGAALRQPLPPDLPDGTYLLSYRVVSADGHPVAGAIVFTIGLAAAPAAPPAPPADAANGWQTAKVVSRLVQTAGLVLAAGGTLFLAIILPPGGTVPKLRLLIIGSAGLAAAAAGLGVAVQGGLLAAAPPSGLLDPAVWRLGAATSTGPAALLLAAALAVMTLGTAWPRHRAGRLAAGLGAVAAAASLALTGHSAAAGWPAQIVLTVHVLTAALWIGALWPLHRVLHAGPAAAATVRRFAALAVPAVMLLLLAGIVTAVDRLDDPAALTGSAYGRLLLAKLAGVLALLAIAWVNRRRVTPALAAGSRPAAATLRRNIRLELALAGAVLLITAALSHTSPRQFHDHHRHVAPLAAEDPPVTLTDSAGRSVVVALVPGRVGANVLKLDLTDAAGQPLATLQVTARLALPAAGVEPLVRDLEPAGPGFGRVIVPIPVAGQWDIRIDALISDFEKAVFTTTIAVR